MFDFKKYVEEKGNTVLMTHIVSGYPDLCTGRKLAMELIKSGADVLKVEIPFSDPIANGSAIVEACETALQRGSTPEDCFDLVRDVTAVSAIPVVIMTYFNPVLRRGIRKFVQDSVESGAAGLIVPDLLLDSPEGTTLVRECREHKLNLIPVVFQGMNKERLAHVLSLGSGFVYATLKVEITDFSTAVNSGSFTDSIAAVCDMPVLSGSGISTVEEVEATACSCSGIVIGNELIRLYQEGGIGSAGGFVSTVSELIKPGKNHHDTHTRELHRGFE